MAASMNTLSIDPDPTESAATKQLSRKARRRQNQRVNAVVMNSSIPGYLLSDGNGSSSTGRARVVARV